MGKSKKPKIERAKEIKKDVILPLQVLSREDYLTAIVLSTLTFVVYAFTAAPGVTMEDSGDFIMGVLTLGIVHPPGYPLYTVLGHLFSLLPFGDPAFRVNLFSALWGSLCLGVMFLILKMLSIERIHAVFAILFLGFTTVFWSKTAVAEVYSFNAFLIACIVFWILSYNRDKKKSQLYLVFLTIGLALSNHYPLVILTGVGLVFLLDRRDLHATDFFKGLIFLGLGLIPYLYLFIQAWNPEVQYNFGRLSDSGMVLDHILRTNYPTQFEGTGWDKLVNSVWFFRTMTTDFFLASVFLYFGLVFCFLKKWKYRYAFLIAGLGPSLGLILILTFTSDDIYQAYLTDYFLPSFLAFSIFLALGLKVLTDRYIRNATLQVSLLLILLLTQAAFNFPRSSHHNDRLIELWGTDLLTSLKPDSRLILCASSLFHIYTLQLVKGLRQDVSIHDRYSLWTKANLYEPRVLFKTNNADEFRKRRELDLLKNGHRPVYYTCRDAISDYKTGFSYTPFIIRADKRHLEDSNPAQFTVSEALLETLVHGYPKSEFWVDRMRRVIFTRLISYFGGQGRPETDQIMKYFVQSKLYSDPKFLLSVGKNLLQFKNRDLALRFFNRAEELSLRAFSPTDLTIYCSLLYNERKTDKALKICTVQEESSAPCSDHAIWAQENLAKIHRETGNWSEVAEYARKIIQCQPDHNVARRYLMMATERAN